MIDFAAIAFAASYCLCPEPAVDLNSDSLALAFAATASNSRSRESIALRTFERLEPVFESLRNRFLNPSERCSGACAIQEAAFLSPRCGDPEHAPRDGIYDRLTPPRKQHGGVGLNMSLLNNYWVT